MKNLTLPLILFLLIGATPYSSNAIADTSWRSINHAIVKAHVVPRYQQLADASLKLEKETEALCSDPSEQHLQQVQSGFHQMMDAWARVQHLRIGPAESLERYHRFQLWPDKHNTGNKQIAKLLAKEDIALLEEQRFQESSVAIQGLSALERLLFSKKTSLDQFIINGKTSYRCHVVKAISHNLKIMSHGLRDDWDNKPPFEMLFIAAGGMMYELKEEKDISVRKEITAVFFNNLYTQVQSIIDQKLLRPLGKSGKVKPRYLESWRSLRSLRNIELNLKSLESLYDTGFASAIEADGDLHSKIKQAFKRTHDAAAAIKAPLYTALENKDQQQEIETLLTSVRQLQSLLTGPLPETLDIELGFNALDGD